MPAGANLDLPGPVFIRHAGAVEMNFPADRLPGVDVIHDVENTVLVIHACQVTKPVVGGQQCHVPSATGNLVYLVCRRDVNLLLAHGDTSRCEAAIPCMDRGPLVAIEGNHLQQRGRVRMTGHSRVRHVDLVLHAIHPGQVMPFRTGGITGRPSGRDGVELLANLQLPQLACLGIKHQQPGPVLVGREEIEVDRLDNRVV